MRQHRLLRALVPVLGIIVLPACGQAVSFAEGPTRTRRRRCRPPPGGRSISAGTSRPILAKRCYSCHGPKKQKSDLRLDRKAAAFKGGAEGPAIVPGEAPSSPLIERVAGDRPRRRSCPPRGSG